MNKAVALANNDVVFLSWIYDTRIPDCLGFTIRRTNLQNRTITTLCLGRIQRPVQRQLEHAHHR